ncbi:MAG: hypothetical protein QGI84_03105 [Dehalococcoidia bacterium]|nr:hypothetical protein [Dehalococcoidia bacterium]
MKLAQHNLALADTEPTLQGVLQRREKAVAVIARNAVRRSDRPSLGSLLRRDRDLRLLGRCVSAPPTLRSDFHSRNGWPVMAGRF